MTNLNSKNWRPTSSLLLFAVGLLVTIIALQIPEVKQLIIKIGRLGIPGAYFGGILYAVSITSSVATVIFINNHTGISLLLLALIGGLGSATYDLTIFYLFRRQSPLSFFGRIRDRLQPHRRWHHILLTLAGLIILASPLPDELAAGFLSVTKLSMKKFMGIAFIANSIGILTILLLS